MSTPFKISEKPPEFPCWCYLPPFLDVWSKKTTEGGWEYYRVDPQIAFYHSAAIWLATHWLHSDTRPTQTPEELLKEVRKDESGGHESVQTSIDSPAQENVTQGPGTISEELLSAGVKNAPSTEAHFRESLKTHLAMAMQLGELHEETDIEYILDLTGDIALQEFNILRVAMRSDLDRVTRERDELLKKERALYNQACDVQHEINEAGIIGADIAEDVKTLRLQRDAARQQLTAAQASVATLQQENGALKSKLLEAEHDASDYREGFESSRRQVELLNDQLSRKDGAKLIIPDL